ncbi:MAG TPA: DUF4097 family beta strand repeat-containing protein [Gemmatimonadales bacterium]|nr:DUF4097 family beta strand repeat-containing protein [Gemmatimonadales bacterium]
MLLSLALAVLAAAQNPDTTVAVTRGQRLEVRAHTGAITVHGWSRDAVRVRADLDGDALDLDQSPVVLSVGATGHRGPPEHATYDITAPTWMAVSLSGVDAEMRVEGIQAPVQIETVDGDVTVQGGAGNVSLRSVEGKVTLSGAKGRIDANSVNSDVTVRDASGGIQATTVDGNVRLVSIASDEVEATTVDGDIVYDGTIRPSGRYRLATHDGDVTLAVPDGTDALVSVSTFDGDFEAAFPVTLRERHGRRFSFTLGGGSARIDLQSFDGTIRLARPGALPTKGGANGARTSASDSAQE